MRKKYLSALLFGALLVTSAGTFTSCKDYDDDINNLQGQIDEIKTTLSELEEQIGATGVSSVTFDEATGMLTVVDGNGTKTYKIQTSAEAKVDATISEDGILTINGKEIGKVADGGDTVTVEGDKLLVNGEEVATLGGEGNYVTMVKDELNKTVILKQGDETVTLPYGADAGVTPSVSIAGTGNITWNVAWGVTEEKIEWNDTEIAAGSLLLGGMTLAPEVTVEPITYDLSAQTLKLVDVDGNYAKVNVEAVASEFDGTTSRAAALNGKYEIKISATNDITAENVATAFTKRVNGVDKNLVYALEVNGTRVTNYRFVIDTYTENEVANIVALEDEDLDAYFKVEPGTTTYSPKGEDASKIAYSYLKFEGAQEAKADVLGIEVDGMKVTVPSSAVSESVVATMYVLDVTGKQTKHNVTIMVGATIVDSTETTEQAVIVVSDGKFTINFGEIMKGLSSEVVYSAKSAKLTTNDKSFFALGLVYPDENGYYPVVQSLTSFKDANEDDVTISSGSNTNEWRKIATAEVTLPKWKYNTDHWELNVVGADTYRSIVTDNEGKPMFGTFELQLSLMDGANGAGNELKKIIIPVKVETPKFEDYYTKNQYAGWNGDAITKTVTLAGLEIVDATDKLFMTKAQTPALATGLSYSYKHNNGTAININNIDSSTEYSAAGIIDNAKKKLKVSSIKFDVTGKTTCKFATSLLATESTAYDLKKTYTMNLKSVLSGIDVKYYVDNVATDEAVLKGTQIVGYMHTNASESTKEDYVAKYSGIALVYNDKPYKLGSSIVIGDYTITPNATDFGSISADNLKMQTALVAGSTGELAASNIVGSGGAINFKAAIDAGLGGGLEFTLQDEVGIQTKLTINYKSVVE